MGKVAKDLRTERASARPNDPTPQEALQRAVKQVRTTRRERHETVLRHRVAS